jgi:hypothetical protein
VGGGGTGGDLVPSGETAWTGSGSGVDYFQAIGSDGYQVSVKGYDIVGLSDSFEECPAEFEFCELWYKVLRYCSAYL